MAVRKIVKIPDPILNTPTKKVGAINASVKAIIQDLLDTLNQAHDPEGAGIAAPQIGSNLRICVVRRFTDNPNEPDKQITNDFVLINPQITFKSNETDVFWEGCLSIPDTYGKVERPRKIKVTALNEQGEIVKFNASDFFARVMQHEIDHLDGILFTSKVIGKPLTESELDKLIEEQDKK